MKRNAIKNMVLTALFAAVMAVCSQLAIPMPTGIPVTLQTFAVALCGAVLGWKRCLASVGVWIALGAVGAPVFSSFRGGVGVLIGPTGGFIFGFLPFAALCGANIKNVPLKIVLCAAGIAICHVLGTVQYSITTGTPFLRSFLLVSAPYLIKDAVSVAAAFLLALAIKKRLVVTAKAA